MKTNKKIEKNVPTQVRLKGIVDGYNEEFAGIVDAKGKKYSLRGVLVGEEVEFTADVNGKTTLQKLNSTNPKRVKVTCPIYSKCGGCRLLHLEYKEQLRLKTEVIEKLFGKYTQVKVNECLGMTKPYNYRNKNQVVFKNDPKEKMICGFYQENSHNVIRFDNCLLQDETSDKIVASIKEILIKMHINAYDEDRKYGLVRHVMVKRSFKTKQTLVVIVTANDNLPGRSNFVKAILAKHKEITTIIQNVNSRQTSAVLGDKNIVLYGPGTILDELCGLKFLISTQSFYQINPFQTEVLYTKALDSLNLSQDDVVLDAYSGVGTIGLIASRKVKKVISVELVKDAVTNGITNAKLNNIKNVHFFCDDATKFINNLAMKKEKIDCVIMDPPRKGSDVAFMNAVLKLMPKKVLYISCNPYTQCEDLKLLYDKYVIKYIQPVDMFPHTASIENIITLERKN